MTNTATSESASQRKRWLAVLARANRSELENALARESLVAPFEYVRAAEPGMVMLRGRIGGTGAAFNLGEASVVRCALRVGGSALGIGYALGRNKRKAELIAVFDALLQDEARREAIQRELIEPLAWRQAAQREAAVQAAAASKVEFFTFVRGQA